MKQESAKYATYWRNNLVDVALQGGKFKPTDLIEISDLDWKSGQLQKNTVQAIFAKIDNEKNTSSELVPSLEILAYVKIHARQSQHGGTKQDGIPSHLSTVMMLANLNRDGNLSATSNPYIPRSLLEPLESKKFFVGTMDEFDRYLTAHSWNDACWEDQMTRCADIEQAVCDLNYLSKQGFSSQDKVYITIIDATAYGKVYAPLIGLYDNMLRDTNIPMPLFDSYTTGVATGSKNVPDTLSTFAVRVGHMEPAYPLANAQRDALSVALTAVEGEIIAVNGPPGTGKTTMLQSVVASLWTTAALEGKDAPPVIVVASTNNQAVTNVIDSFGKVADKKEDVFAGRWLPNITSYGCYYPAQGKKEDARKNEYQIDEIWAQIENMEYLVSAEDLYLKAVNRALNYEYHNIQDATDAIRKHMLDTHTTLSLAATNWSRMQTNKADLFQMLGDKPQERLSGIKSEYENAIKCFDEMKRINLDVEKHLATEPFVFALFSFIPAVDRKRLARLRVDLSFDTLDWPADTLKQLVASLREHRSELAKITKCKEVEYDAGNQIFDKYLRSVSQWQSTTKSLGIPDGADINDYDLAADTSIRQSLFKQATHYWEGRWLMEVRKLLPEGDSKKTGKSAIEARWRRRAMVTPCAVSTMFLLPRLFTASRPKDGEWHAVPLYNFIDLLIIDESGQVSPSIGGVGFALASRALVVGDTKQITPIINCDKASDAGNLREARISSSYKEVELTGRGVYYGSVMKVAQAACHYHYDKRLDRGMMLYEHRRCVNDIIEFCNKLCYEGQLLPKRGNSQHGQHELPRIGYLHVPGESETYAKSRRNPPEAEVVVNLVAAHAEKLMNAYQGKALKDLVAIVTPFAQQAGLIERGLIDSGYGGITVGTVHRMQGAEFPVVLFSSVYTRHDANRYMLDETPNMLNVAVSRAQDSFIVIGDMDAFDERDNEPSSVLAAHLFAKGHEIKLKPRMRKSEGLTTGGEEISFIATQKDHDAFLLDALTSAQREVIIVSPWISGSVINFTGLSKRVEETVRRNVKVRIYTDMHFNMHGDNISDSAILAKQKLTAAGAEVIFVRRIHNKDVFVDEDRLCRGSFNWLSVFRTEGDEQQLDASVSYVGGKVKEEKACMLSLLEKRLAQSTCRI